MKILIIEDEVELASSMGEYLKGSQFVCEFAYDYMQAEEKVFLYEYDCILLDLMLPGGTGLDLLRLLKKEKSLEGVIIISAKDSIKDKVEGLQLGADDYLAKPFHLSELLARIQSVIRRRSFDNANVLYFSNLSIDTLSREVKSGENRVDLTKKEYDLLLFLIGNDKRVISKAAIAEQLSGDMADSMGSHDFIYAHIKNLKKKLAKAGAEDHIRTIYGLGYKWES